MSEKAKKTKKVVVQVTDNIFKSLAKIQQELKAPKGQFNKFANFNYRSCEDILEAVKPLLDGKLVLTLSDDVVLVGERYYIKATAKLSNGKDSLYISAFARESLERKGMDDSQITGATSSYARKYALNGLFAIDDTKDSDVERKIKVIAEKLLTSKDLKALASILQSITNAKSVKELEEIGAKIKTDSKTEKYSANQIKVLREAYDGKKKKLVQPSK